MFQLHEAHGFDMNRVRELIHAADSLHLVAARLEGLQVSGQAGRFTGNI